MIKERLLYWLQLASVSMFYSGAIIFLVFFMSFVIESLFRMMGSYLIIVLPFVLLSLVFGHLLYERENS